MLFGSKPRIVTFLSALGHEEKNATLVNLSAGLGQLGNDVVLLDARNQESPSMTVAMWLETSHVDAVSYSSSAAFLRAVRPPLAVDAVVLQNAGHRDSLWEGLTPASLTWLGANIAGFKVKASGAKP